MLLWVAFFNGTCAAAKQLECVSLTVRLDAAWVCKGPFVFPSSCVSLCYCAHAGPSFAHVPHGLRVHSSGTGQFIRKNKVLESLATSIKGAEAGPDLDSDPSFYNQASPESIAVNVGHPRKNHQIDFTCALLDFFVCLIIICFICGSASASKHTERGNMLDLS